jgi:hypothetical protein
MVLDIRDVMLHFAVWAFTASMQHISSLKAVSRLLTERPSQLLSS